MKYSKLLSWHGCLMPCPSIRSKMILDCPNCFGHVQIDLVMSKLFWSGLNHFGQVQIKLFWTNFYKLNLSEMIWTQPKQLVLDQNDLAGPKSFWIHRRTRHKCKYHVHIDILAHFFSRPSQSLLSTVTVLKLLKVNHKQINFWLLSKKSEKFQVPFMRII